ncbi:MAG: hypothetical protein WB709_09255 [Solirubrobacteraceae bacterium]
MPMFRVTVSADRIDREDQDEDDATPVLQFYEFEAATPEQALVEGVSMWKREQGTQVDPQFSDVQPVRGQSSEE